MTTTTTAKNPQWQYQTATGQTVTGAVERTVDLGGTDVTYMMRRASGELDVLSGSRLKTLQRLWPSEPAPAPTAPTKRYEVQTRIGSTWSNVWTEDDAPLTFASRADAAAELDEHLYLSAEAHSRGDLATPARKSDFRVRVVLRSLHWTVTFESGETEDGAIEVPTGATDKNIRAAIDADVSDRADAYRDEFESYGAITAIEWHDQ